MTAYTYIICTVVLRNTLTVQSFCFLAELSCKFVRLPKLTEVGTNWYKLVQVGTQVGTNWYKLAQIGTNWYKLVQIDTNWYKLVQIGTRVGTNWYKLVQIGTIS